jgi:hypothetical protein
MEDAAMSRRTVGALRRRAARLSFAYREFMWRNHWIRQLLSVTRWQPIRLSVLTIGVVATLPGLLNAGGTVMYAVAGAPATATVVRCREIPNMRGGTVECTGSWTFADGRTGSGPIHQLGNLVGREGGTIPVRAGSGSARVNPFDVRYILAGLLFGGATAGFAWWSARSRRHRARHPAGDHGL